MTVRVDRGGVPGLPRAEARDAPPKRPPPPLPFGEINRIVRAESKDLSSRVQVRIRLLLAEVKADRFSAALEVWKRLDNDVGFVGRGAHRLDRVLLAAFGDPLDPRLKERDPSWRGDPQDDAAWYVLNDRGIASTALGPLAEAIRAFDRVVEASLSAASQAEKGRDWALASSQTRTAINGLLNRAEALAYLGDLSAMAETLERAIALSGEAERHLDPLPKGKAKDAELALVAQRRRDIRPYEGLLLVLRGDLLAALAAFEAAGALSDQPQVWHARALLSAGDTAGAQREAKAARKGANGEPVTLARALAVLAEIEPERGASLELYARAESLLDKTSATYAKIEVAVSKARRLIAEGTRPGVRRALALIERATKLAAMGPFGTSLAELGALQQAAQHRR